MIKVYPTDTQVFINKDIEGTIKQILIEGENIQYKVGFWDGRSYKSEWFNTIELTTRATKTVQIGFKNE